MTSSITRYLRLTGRILPPTASISGLLTLSASLLIWTGCKPSDAPSSTQAPGQTEASSADATSPESPAADPAFRKLQGAWARTDGDYTIVVQYAGSDGKVEAAYFNPNPIYVSRAEAVPDGKSVKLFVELQDVGYPGCSYTLLYDPTSDQLAGSYYQAAQRQTYDVVFTRSER